MWGLHLLSTCFSISSCQVKNTLVGQMIMVMLPLPRDNSRSAKAIDMYVFPRPMSSHNAQLLRPIRYRARIWYAPCGGWIRCGIGVYWAGSSCWNQICASCDAVMVSYMVRISHRPILLLEKRCS